MSFGPYFYPEKQFTEVIEGRSRPHGARDDDLGFVSGFTNNHHVKTMRILAALRSGNRGWTNQTNFDLQGDKPVTCKYANWFTVSWLLPRIPLTLPTGLILRLHCLTCVE